MFVGIVVLFGGLFTWYAFYRMGGHDGAIALNKQLQSIISTHDLGVIKHISGDLETEEFLTQLPRAAKVATEKTSDAQGGFLQKGIGMEYYATMVDDKRLNVYMKEDSRSFPYALWPKWSVYKVSVHMLPTMKSVEP